jgi:hypothetical protein
LRHNQTLQWTGPALRFLVNSKSVGAVPAIERRSVIPARQHTMLKLILRIFLDNVGGRLVLPDNCSLPKRCAVCNKPVDGPARRLRLRCTAVGSGFTRYTIHLHLCRWHGARRKLMLLMSGALMVACAILISGVREGEKPSSLQFAGFCGLIVAGLIFVNLLLHDPFFRGLDLEAGGMAIKGFGKRFREQLRPEEVVVPVSSRIPPAVRVPE